MGLTDIHTHILYGVDDGARDLQESMRLLNQEWEQGIDQVVLTPHYGPKFGCPEVQIVEERFKEICEEVGKFYPKMQLFLGNEIYYQENQTIQDLKEGKVLSLNKTRYVLVEFGPGDSFSRIFRAVQEFGYAGYIPIIAHVERYDAVRQQINHAMELVKAGAYLQVNAKTLTGGMFDQKTTFWKKLLKEKVLHFIASDCHDDCGRRPNMEQGAAVLQKRKADGILYKNPKSLLEGKYI